MSLNDTFEETTLQITSKIRGLERNHELCTYGKCSLLRQRNSIDISCVYNIVASEGTIG